VSNKRNKTHHNHLEKVNTITNKTRHRASTSTLADISRSALCCHSTHAPIANLPNIAQLEGTP